VVKEMVHLFKYKHRKPLGNILSGLMADFARRYPEVLDGIDMVTFVPLRKSRLREREFNQSEMLARDLAAEFGLKVSGSLRKIKRTRPQNELARSERLVNLKGAFRAENPCGIRGERILLVDDVMTTGSTLSECAAVLREAGAGGVRCLTLARGT
jgi:ComF family protein